MPRTPDAILDEFLVLQAQAGRPEAWRGLLERWHPLLLRRAARLLGDAHAGADATQDAWLAIARGLARLEDPARFAPWAYRILARRCADTLSRRTRRAEGPGDVASAPSRPEAPDTSDEVAAMRRAIAGLPMEQRLLLSMRYADGVPGALIAEILGIPAGTVKSRLHTAREALRRLIENEPHHRGARHG